MTQQTFFVFDDLSCVGKRSPLGWWARADCPSVRTSLGGIMGRVMAATLLFSVASAYDDTYHSIYDPPLQPEWPANESAISVACVGDSITAGYLSTGGLTYPNQLQRLLGSGYRVMNFGEGGRTMLKHGDNPYWISPGYKRALASNASLLVLMLGTNDAKYANWGHLASEFPGDYADMIASFANMQPRPKIWLMVPPPLYRAGTYGMNQTVINSLFPASDGAAAVRTVANAANLVEPIDLYSLFQSHCPVTGGTPGHPPNQTLIPCDWIARGGTDACHPNDVGYGKIAEAVKTAIAP